MLDEGGHALHHSETQRLIRLAMLDVVFRVDRSHKMFVRISYLAASLAQHGWLSFKYSMDVK
eukprot:1056208-Amphidinium_carterae.1